MIKNYCFDFDSTLIDSDELNVMSTQEAYREMNWPVPSIATVRSYIGLPIEVSFPKMAPKKATDEQMQQLYRVFVKEYDRLEPGKLKLFPGMADILKTLVDEGKKLFVVSSNRSDVIVDNLKRLGVSQYFQTIVGFDKIKHAKPAPDGVLKVLHDYNLQADETIMIGDATFDLQMGKNARVHTAGVTWGAHHSTSLQQLHPDYLFNQVKQLLTIK